METGAVTAGSMPSSRHVNISGSGSTHVHLLCFPERGARRPYLGEPGSLAHH